MLNLESVSAIWQEETIRFVIGLSYDCQLNFLIIEMNDTPKLYEPPVATVSYLKIESSILSTSTTLNPMENGDDLSEGW